MNLEDLKKTGARDSLRMHPDVKEKIVKDHGSISRYFHKCVGKDYKLSNGKVVKRLKKWDQLT